MIDDATNLSKAPLQIDLVHHVTEKIAEEKHRANTSAPVMALMPLMPIGTKVRLTVHSVIIEKN